MAEWTAFIVIEVNDVQTYSSLKLLTSLYKQVPMGAESFSGSSCSLHIVRGTCLYSCTSWYTPLIVPPVDPLLALCLCKIRLYELSAAHMTLHCDITTIDDRFVESLRCNEFGLWLVQDGVWFLWYNFSSCNVLWFFSNRLWARLFFIFF